MDKFLESFIKLAEKKSKKLGLTHMQIGERAGMDRAAVSRALSGKRSINTETISKLSHALKIEWEEILGDKDVTPQDTMELLQDPERLAVLALILSLEKDKLGTVREVVSRFASSGLDKNKPAASG